MRFAVTPDEFDDRVREAIAEKSGWFEGAEPPVREEAAAKVEARLGRALPTEFRHFAVAFGGGYFGRVNISTLDETSDWYVLSRPPIKVNDESMLVVSDDEAGGYYGFVLDGDRFGTEVTYINPDDGNHTEEAAPSFFEFIEKLAIDV